PVCGTGIRQNSMIRSASASARRRLIRYAVGRTASDTQRFKLDIGVAPGVLELRLVLCGLVLLAFGFETSRESIERSRIAGVDLQIGAIDRLRRLWLPLREQLGSQPLAHREVPQRRLFIDQRILHRDRLGEVLLGKLVVILRRRDLAGQYF